MPTGPGGPSRSQSAVRYRPYRKQPGSPMRSMLSFTRPSITESLTAAPPASRNTLIRRAYLDLIGLLPTPEEVDQFINDKSPNAWEKVIDRLLVSEHYGERWGRHWLDVARYADSWGHIHDDDNPNAWRYRDYVIKSFNDDKPYTRFIQEQLAGDELDEVSNETLIATSFHRIGPRVRFREKQNPHYRYDYLDDMVGTTAKGFLGLTVNCARCHDHKFDPISHMDYYRMVGDFFPVYRLRSSPCTAGRGCGVQPRKGEIDAQIAPLKKQIRDIEAPYRKQAFEKKLSTFPEDVQIAVRTPEDRPDARTKAACRARCCRSHNINGRRDLESPRRIASRCSRLRQDPRT